MAEGGSNNGGGANAGRPTRAAVIGYGSEAREQAVKLRAIGWEVDVVMRPGGMSWIRAVADGFRPAAAGEAASRAEVVVIQLPDAEQPALWAYSLEPAIAPGTLVVFARASAIYSGAVDPDPRLDVVLVTADDGLACGRSTADGADANTATCRVAVHRDATGHALERAMSFARAVYGAPRIGTTTLEAEVRTELSELVAQKGGLTTLLAEWDRFLANPSHEPDQATLTYYERLRATVLAGQGPVTIKPPRSRTELSERPRLRASRKRGAA